jgi:hypothetical protein
VSETLPLHEPGERPAPTGSGEVTPVVSHGLAGAVGRRLASCPAVRPEAVADARARLASDHPPSGDEVADALVHSLVVERLT